MKKKTQEIPLTEEKSYFDGSAWGYIGYSLLSKFVTLITLGLAYPWMLCMRQRWQARHTVINGNRQVFDGKGVQLIGRYLLWWFLSAITFGIYGIWMGLALKKWKAKHTHLQGQTDNNSYFDGGIGGYIGIRLLSGWIKMATLGIGSAWANKLVLDWETRHTVVDSRRLIFTGTGGNLFVKYLLWGFLTTITLGIFALFVPVKTLRWQTEHTIDHAHTMEALLKRSEQKSAAHTDGVAMKTCRMQDDMEIVRAGVTDTIPEETLRGLAESGSRGAQYAYVTRFSRGDVTQEPFAGFVKSSAQQGFAPAMYLYVSSGLCVLPEETEAMIQGAAEKGVPGAMHLYLQHLQDKALKSNQYADLQQAAHWHDVLVESGETMQQQEEEKHLRCIQAMRKIESAKSARKASTAGKVVVIILVALAALTMLAALITGAIMLLKGMRSDGIGIPGAGQGLSQSAGEGKGNFVEDIFDIFGGRKDPYTGGWGASAGDAQMGVVSKPGNNWTDPVGTDPAEGTQPADLEEIFLQLSGTWTYHDNPYEQDYRLVQYSFAPDGTVIDDGMTIAPEDEDWAEYTINGVRYAMLSGGWGDTGTYTLQQEEDRYLLKIVFPENVQTGRRETTAYMRILDEETIELDFTPFDSYMGIYIAKKCDMITYIDTVLNTGE